MVVILGEGKSEMEPIQSGLQSAGVSLTPNSTSVGETTALTSGSEIQASAVATTSSSMSVSTVSQQVGVFLEELSPQLADNEYLKLLIAAMILQALLSEDGGAQQTAQAGLKALEYLAGSKQSAMYVSMSIESSTTSVQMQQQAAEVYTNSAVQATSNTGEGQGGQAAGGQVDVSA